MSFLKLGFLNGADILFIIIFLVILIFFMKEFKVTSKQSWLALLGFTALGGVFTFQTWKRKQLLKQLEKREAALNELEKTYDNLKKQAHITEAAYQQAKTELDRAKLQESLAIAKADQELAARVSDIEKEYQNMSIEDSVAKIKEALKSK